MGYIFAIFCGTSLKKSEARVRYLVYIYILTNMLKCVESTENIGKQNANKATNHSSKDTNCSLHSRWENS